MNSRSEQVCVAKVISYLNKKPGLKKPGFSVSDTRMLSRDARSLRCLETGQSEASVYTTCGCSMTL